MPLVYREGMFDYIRGLNNEELASAINYFSYYSVLAKIDLNRNFNKSIDGISCLFRFKAPNTLDHEFSLYLIISVTTINEYNEILYSKYLEIPLIFIPQS